MQILNMLTDRKNIIILKTYTRSISKFYLGHINANSNEISTCHLECNNLNFVVYRILFPNFQ